MTDDETLRQQRPSINTIRNTTERVNNLFLPEPRRSEGRGFTARWLSPGAAEEEEEEMKVLAGLRHEMNPDYSFNKSCNYFFNYLV